MSTVDTALGEINAALAALAPAHEGLRDFAGLNLHRDSQLEVRAALGVFDRRVGLLKSAKLALEQLAADGHPTLPARDVVADVLADLRENAATIAAALKQFTSADPATSLNLAASPAAPK